MAKQKDIIGLPPIDLTQQGMMFDLTKYSTIYSYELGKRVFMNLSSLGATAYTYVTVSTSDDPTPTWRDLAYTYMGNYTSAWWVILIFNGVEDATKFPVDLIPEGQTQVQIAIPTVSTLMNFLQKMKSI